jgi:hypothetical protein
VPEPSLHTHFQPQLRSDVAEPGQGFRVSVFVFGVGLDSRWSSSGLGGHCKRFRSCSGLGRREDGCKRCVTNVEQR